MSVTGYTKAGADAAIAGAITGQKGVANGLATLDGSGRVPASQLTLDAMEYKGAWNASTNTPTLANGTGNQGDFYKVSASGSVNFGAGSITFSIGDSVLYDGSVWQRISSVDAADLSATYEAKAATAEYLFHVSQSGNDSNDGKSWGTAFATIGAALAAAGSNACKIRVGSGNWTISAADASGNGVTLNNPSSELAGRGVDRTMITIGANVGWGIVGQGARCEVRDIQVVTASGAAVTYAVVGASTVSKTSASAESMDFKNLYVVAGAGSTVNACYAVGNDTTGANIDLAFTVFNECVANGNNVATHGFYLGNGTGGNILKTELETCQANACTNGLTANSTGYRWSGGGMSGNTAVDFNYLGGVQDVATVIGGRYENGKRFFNSNSSTGPYAGFTFIGCLLGNYTPSDNIIFQSSSNCPITILGGQYCMSSAVPDSSLFSVTSNGNRLRTFTAIGVTMNNPAGWPAAASYLRRTFINCGTIDSGGHPIADDTHDFVVDGGYARTTTAAKTSSYNMVLTDSIIPLNGTSITGSFPDPTAVTKGVPYSFVNENATAATINSQGTSKTINGAASLSLAQWETITAYSDGTQWIGLTNTTPSNLSIAQSQVSGLVAALAALAPLASPALTGNPTAPTQTLGDNSTKIATTAFVQANAGGGSSVPLVPSGNLETASGTYTVPGSSGNSILRITAVGGGAGGSGGGSALTSGGVTTQVGGGAGGAGATTVSIQTVAKGTVLTHTIGAGGTAGNGGAANSNAGTDGGVGGTTTVTGSGLTTIQALGGGNGQASAANSTSTVGGGYGGTGHSRGATGTASSPIPGSGGQATTATGFGLSAAFTPFGQCGGCGGAPANSTNGGLGGPAGSVGGINTTVSAGGSGTSTGGNGGSAAANSGCGGGGGGGGAPGGAGGNGGTGGSGWVLYEVIG